MSVHSTSSIGCPKIPVIIDTDPGVDDVAAILLALASPELEILGYVISFGNTDTASSYKNIYKIYEALSRHVEQNPEDAARFPNLSAETKPFVAAGADGPLQGDIHSAQYFHGRDGLGEISTRHPELIYETQEGLPYHPQLRAALSGVDAALEVIHSRPAGSITYIVLGPHTNLASMLLKDPTAVRERLGLVVSMGGALDVPGNTSPVAEFNFFADPFSVKDALVSKSKDKGLELDRFLLLPLDITTSHQLPFPEYKARIDESFSSRSQPSEQEGKSPLVHFTSSFLEWTRDVMLSYGCDYMELHDIVAIWCAIENPPPAHKYMNNSELSEGWATMRRKFDIERTGELTRGMLVIDRREDSGAYEPGANRAEVTALLEKHSAVAPDHADAAPIPVEEIPPHEADLGVNCVVGTPGPRALVTLLFERIWGISA